MEEKVVALAGSSQPSKYYSINEGDHVAVLPVLPDGNILLVRQYRPALDDYLIELPGGHAGHAEPEQAARQELLEETGYEAGQMRFLGKVVIDSGRNQGYLFCYSAVDLKKVSEGEAGIELSAVTPGKLGQMILAGDFAHSQNLCAVFLGVLRGFLSLK